MDIVTAALVGVLVVVLVLLNRRLGAEQRRARAFELALGLQRLSMAKLLLSQPMPLNEVTLATNDLTDLRHHVAELWSGTTEKTRATAVALAHLTPESVFESSGLRLTD